MRWVIRIAVVLALLWVILTVGLLIVMMQPPATFNQVMARLPMPLLLAVPFEPLWNYARGGELEPGHPAPDFFLPTLDRTSTIRLSSFRGSKPVVLVFGSYT
jgi:hypothetical protein